MSYEGYEQKICKKGHYWTIDSQLTTWKEEKEKCLICGEEEVWTNSVDVTNGSFDEEDNRIDGYVEPELDEMHHEICSVCGRTHICECSIYKIPGEKK